MPEGLDLEDVLSARVRFDGTRHVVELSGQLDLASSTAAVQACASIDHQHVVVDLSELEFMDSAGYGALVSSMTILERRGGSLVLRNPAGEPKRLLELIERLERGPCTPEVLSPSRNTAASASGELGTMLGHSGVGDEHADHPLPDDRLALGGSGIAGR